jgi:hypothetical protein
MQFSSPWPTCSGTLRTKHVNGPIFGYLYVIFLFHLLMIEFEKCHDPASAVRLEK